MRIRSIGVVGAGTMGSGIAALAASAGIPVVLLDIPGERDRNEPAKRGLQRALKARPPAFMDPKRAGLIAVGNFEDDLDLLARCDWVIEAVIEELGPKRALFDRLTPILAPGTIVSSNTSGIPMRLLVEGRDEAFRRRFLGAHFFNPPRYLHLLEVIPTPETDPDVVETIEQFATLVLGKGVVRAKDVPGFIGNRLGIYGMIQAIRLMERFGLTIDEVDALTGELIGRPRSATFRTADLSGLDILKHVADGLSEATGNDYRLPVWVEDLVARGSLGEKTGVGFYRREGRDILTLDPATMEYHPRAETRSPELGALSRRPLQERLRQSLDLPGPHGEFLRTLFLTTAHETLTLAPDLAWDIPSIDRALEWGFGWELGPFRQMDAVGLAVVRAGLGDAGLDEPDLLRSAGDGFYASEGGRETYRGFDGAPAPLPERPCHAGGKSKLLRDGLQLEAGFQERAHRHAQRVEPFRVDLADLAGPVEAGHRAVHGQAEVAVVAAEHDAVRIVRQEPADDLQVLLLGRFRQQSEEHDVIGRERIRLLGFERRDALGVILHDDKLAALDLTTVDERFHRLLVGRSADDRNRFAGEILDFLGLVGFPGQQAGSRREVRRREVDLLLAGERVGGRAAFDIDDAFDDHGDACLCGDDGILHREVRLLQNGLHFVGDLQAEFNRIAGWLLVGVEERERRRSVAVADGDGTGLIDLLQGTGEFLGICSSGTKRKTRCSDCK